MIQATLHIDLHLNDDTCTRDIRPGQAETRHPVDIARIRTLTHPETVRRAALHAPVAAALTGLDLDRALLEGRNRLLKDGAK